MTLRHAKPKLKINLSTKLKGNRLKVLKKKKRLSQIVKLRRIRFKRKGAQRVRKKESLKRKVLIKKKKRLGKKKLVNKKLVNKRLRKKRLGKKKLGKKRSEKKRLGKKRPEKKKKKSRFRKKKSSHLNSRSHVPDLQLPEVDYFDSMKDYIDSARNTAVSVVIPTLNAGPEFRQLMQMLSIQKPFARIEIIVIDSGSTDETVSIAQEYNAKIICIPQEQFSHSYVRNLGADHSSGSDYLLFMTQDALPPTEHWTYRMYAAAVTHGAAAVSCSETMKEDVDLYYRVISWGHYKYLGVLNTDKIMQLPKHQTYNTLRVNAQLMNNSCFIRKDVFMGYKFRLEYAEDLDLGLRLIKNGHKLALLGQTRVIHSHNRPAFYYLKRGYVNSLTLMDMFKDYPLPEPVSGRELAGQIVYSYGVISALVHELYATLYPYCSVTDLLHETLGFINRAITNVNHSIPLYNHLYIDDEFYSYVDSIQGIARVSERHDLLDSVKDFAHGMCDYLRQAYESINPFLLDEVKHCLFKVLADRIGSLLVSSYSSAAENKREDLDHMIRPVVKGVKV